MKSLELRISNYYANRSIDSKIYQILLNTLFHFIINACACFVNCIKIKEIKSFSFTLLPRPIYNFSIINFFKSQFDFKMA